MDIMRLTVLDRGNNNSERRAKTRPGSISQSDTSHKAQHARFKGQRIKPKEIPQADQIDSIRDFIMGICSNIR